jgi:mannose-6-phosphate isomerase-like protein (cupin superfamily)
MIQPGQILDNPVTGERLIFHETSATTDGEAVVFDTVVRPNGFVAAAHVHPFQHERFEVLEGTLELELGRETLRLRAKDTVTVEPGTRHRFRNAGRDDVRFRCEVRPALSFESLLETMFALAASGKTNRRGLPGPLRLAVIARAHFDTVRLPFPPPLVQRAALAVGAPLGRLLGYRATAPSARPAPRARPHGRPVRRYLRGGPHR